LKAWLVTIGSMFFSFGGLPSTTQGLLASEQDRRTVGSSLMNRTALIARLRAALKM
jgi:hypothetical protein